MRQRSKDTWELRLYVGVDPETGRERWGVRSVHGSKRAAQRALAELVGCGPPRAFDGGGPVGGVAFGGDSYDDAVTLMRLALDRIAAA
jgi:hypothetical protein